MKIKFNSDDELPPSKTVEIPTITIGKLLAFHNAIILIKPVARKDKNIYYYNIFFKKGLYKDKSNTNFF